jgi:hypothetical protein
LDGPGGGPAGERVLGVVESILERTRRGRLMTRNFFVCLMSALAIIALAAEPVIARAETKTLVSNEQTSLCVNPKPGFAPKKNGTYNYAPLVTPHNGAFPETAKSCSSGFSTTATVVSSPPWSGSISGASWVSFNNTGYDQGNSPVPRYYIYDASFTLCPNQTTDARLEGNMLADDIVGAFLNGQPIGNDPYPGYDSADQTTPKPFGPASGPFKAGTNTIQFVVYDEYGYPAIPTGYTGLDFSASVTSEVACETPEFPGIGRCLKVASGTGDYNDAGCEKTEVSNGKDEWYAGAVKNKFTSAEGQSTLEGPGGQLLVTCTGDTDVGEYNGESEDRETITFTGCSVSGGTKCTTASEPAGTIKTAELRSLYGFIERPKDLGVSLEAVTGNFAEFACGSEAVVVRGSVIAPITPVSKMTTTFKEKFKGAKDRQDIQKFEGEPTDVLEVSVNGGAFGEAAFTSTDTVTNEEPLEIREAP